MIIRFSSRESNQISYEEANRRMEVGKYLEAFKSFLAIAQRGHSPSMSMLGALLTQHGLELKEYGGYEEGISWYRKAATCGDVIAIKALSELNEKPVIVFKSFLPILILQFLVYPLGFIFGMVVIAAGIHMLHVFLIVASIACFSCQFPVEYYLFESCRLNNPPRRYEVEKEYAYSSVAGLIIHIVGMILFVIGFGLAAKNVSKGDNGLFIAMLVQILMAAWIIYLNTILIVRIKRRALNDTQYKALMNLTTKLGKRWEAFIVPLLLLDNLVLFAMCLYRVIIKQ